MKIWKIVGVLGVVVLALGILGVGIVFAQNVVPGLASNAWGGMMGRLAQPAGQQATPAPGSAESMMKGAENMMGQGGMMNGSENMMGQGNTMNHDEMMGQSGMMGSGDMMDGQDMGAMHAWMMGPDGMHTQVLADLAKTLNLTPKDLQSQITSGKTLTQIAQEKGVSQDQLQTALEASIKDNLAKAVAAGKLTQAQADQMLSDMDGNYAQMLDMMGSGMMSEGAEGCHGNKTPAGSGA